mgnify:FL=1
MGSEMCIRDRYKASQEDGENSDKEPGSADFDDNIVDADFEDLDDEQRS